MIAAIIYLKSKAEILKSFNPNFGAEINKGNMNKEVRAQATEQEIRNGMINIIAIEEAPLHYIWNYMVQTYLRYNPNGVDGTPDNLITIPLEDLINRLKHTANWLDFDKKQS